MVLLVPFVPDCATTKLVESETRALLFVNMDSSEDVEMLDSTKKNDVVASNSEESTSKSKANIPW